MWKDYKNNQGFSILEAVVAFYLITMGMVGLLSLISYSIKTQYITKNMVIGSQLAQEGIELVRNTRDTNWLNHRNWLTGGSSGSDIDILQDNDYTIDYTGVIDDSIDDIAGARLYLDNSNHDFYTHDSTDPNNKPTAFYRLIQIDDSVLDKIVVRSRVRWMAGGQNHEYVAETELWNWSF